MCITYKFGLRPFLLMRNRSFWISPIRHIFPYLFFTLLFYSSTFGEELQWKIMGHLLEKRSMFQSARISHDRILVFGGFSEQYGNQLHRQRGLLSRTSEIIDVTQRKVFPSSNMNVPHADGAVVQMSDSNIIVISGLNTDSTTTKVCELYDVKRNSWHTLGSLLIGRHGHTAYLLNKDDILIVGGQAEANYAPVVAESEIFNIRTGKSRLVKDFPSKIMRSGVFTSSIWKPGKTLFIGGRSGGAGSFRTLNIYSYDTLNQSWKHEGKHNEAVYAFGSTRLLKNNAVVILGGSKANHYFTNSNQAGATMSNSIYIETENGLSYSGKSLFPRAHCEVQPWNNEIILIIGGTNNNDIFSHTEWFDVRSKEHSVGVQLNEPRKSPSSYAFQKYNEQGEIVSTSIIVIGGVGANDVNLSSIEILETSNPECIELPSEEISILRWKKIFSSLQFVSILVGFLILLVIALVYLLFQVLHIRQKTRKTSQM